MSWRDTQEGSLFVVALCDVVKKLGSSNHLQDLLTKVNGKLSETKIEIGKEIYFQTTYVISTLRKNVWFNFPPDNTLNNLLPSMR